MSGEESPGVLSDDQPPESPSDSNESDDTNKNMPWLKVSYLKKTGKLVDGGEAYEDDNLVLCNKHFYFNIFIFFTLFILVVSTYLWREY